MFNLFKKKQPEPETQLTDHVPVDNLKAYVVRGYETEKRLTAELDRKNQTIKEFDATKVILSEKERDIRELENQNKEINQLENKIIEAEKLLNERKIIIKNLYDERQNLELQTEEHFTTLCKQSIINRVEQHKGNLSKAKAIEIVESES